MSRGAKEAVKSSELVELANLVGDKIGHDFTRVRQLAPAHFEVKSVSVDRANCSVSQGSESGNAFVIVDPASGVARLIPTGDMSGGYREFFTTVESDFIPGAYIKKVLELPEGRMEGDRFVMTKKGRLEQFSG